MVMNAIINTADQRSTIPNAYLARGCMLPKFRNGVMLRSTHRRLLILTQLILDLVNLFPGELRTVFGPEAFAVCLLI